LPTITFVGTANAIVYSGVIPHFVDIEIFHKFSTFIVILLKK
jgi:dTDP-4-amino-4,6-dideoxygalactose transaminase